MIILLKTHMNNLLFAQGALSAYDVERVMKLDGHNANTYTCIITDTNSI